MYRDWDNKKRYLHMIKHLAINAFGFTHKQLPELPEELENANDYFTACQDYFATLVEQIVEKIVKEFHSKMEKRDGFCDKSVPQLNALLFHQIRLNIFCVGLQEVMANGQRYNNYSNFQTDFKLGIGSYFRNQNPPSDSDKANKILNKMRTDERAKVKAWEEIFQEGTKEMHRQICGPQKIGVSVE
jgi:hypothetical protein